MEMSRICHGSSEMIWFRGWFWKKVWFTTPFLSNSRVKSAKWSNFIHFGIVTFPLIVEVNPKRRCFVLDHAESLLGPFRRGLFEFICYISMGNTPYDRLVMGCKITPMVTFWFMIVPAVSCWTIKKLAQCFFFFYTWSWPWFFLLSWLKWLAT